MTKINKFTNSEFGSLTTLTSGKTGKTMFLGKEIAEKFGHTNLTQTIKRLLKDDERLVVSRTQFKEFFKELELNNLLVTKTQKIILISESGLYKLIMASTLEKAEVFKDWIAREVLPSIRRTGTYSFSQPLQGISQHMQEEVQKTNSKEVATRYFENGGADAIIGYNRESCFLHSGIYPKDVIEMGKQLGLSSKDTSSAKQVYRKVKPELAAAMSFTDNLTKHGHDLKKISQLAKQYVMPLFEKMIELGAIPKELNE